MAKPSSDHVQQSTLCDKGGDAKFGCSHYTRKCRLVAPCCGKIYSCRFCHDDDQTEELSKVSNKTLDSLDTYHTLDRKKVEEVECCQCGLRQEVRETCRQCATVFGEAYFCPICRLFDDVDKKQFHCEGCGICRVGGRNNFVHCATCSMCFKTEATHRCIENSSKNNCAICMEDIHGSRQAAAVPPCGHLLHMTCQNDMFKNGLYACPSCGVSMLDMSQAWKSIDKELEDTPMPPEYANLYRAILCKDCNTNSKTKFHVVGMKCQKCGSFNTAMGEGAMLKKKQKNDDAEEDSFEELSDEEMAALCNIRLPVPEGVEDSDDDDELDGDGDLVHEDGTDAAEDGSRTLNFEDELD